MEKSCVKFEFAMNKKVKCKNKIEFMNYVAEDCLKDMYVEDKECLMENPVAIEYHFSYCLYIQNNYIPINFFVTVRTLAVLATKVKQALSISLKL